MLRKTTLLTLVGLAILLAGCKKNFSSPEPAIAVPTAPLYYTQFSLFEEKNNFRTTNYRKGILIPINTEVSLVSINAKEATLRLVSSGLQLTIENVPKHTNDDMQTAFNKIVSPNKVDLSHFSAAERESIMVGKAIKGMSKKAVIAAIGYPPTTETPSIDANDWTYWAHRYDRFVVHFKDGKVDNIVD